MRQRITKMKNGDTVKVLRGKDGGKIGKVTQVLPSAGRVVVDGVNRMIKHLRSARKGEKGQRIEFFGPIPVSNVQLLCPKCQKSTRIAFHLAKGEDGTLQKNRQCKKCQATFS